jgi:hypothetical protein
MKPPIGYSDVSASRSARLVGHKHSLGRSVCESEDCIRTHQSLVVAQRLLMFLASGGRRATRSEAQEAPGISTSVRVADDPPSGDGKRSAVSRIYLVVRAGECIQAEWPRIHYRGV